jgi:HEAT repeat protein
MYRAIFALVLVGSLAGCSSGPTPNMDSGDPYERYLGALEAAESGDPAALKKVEALLKDPDPLTRTGAVVALTKARPEGALKLLIGMLSDADPGVRTGAVRALSWFKDPASLDALARVLKLDADVEPRRVAALALGEFQDSPAVRALLLEAFKDREAGVAYNAYRSLIRVTGRHDLPRDRAAAEEALKRS